MMMEPSQKLVKEYIRVAEEALQEARVLLDRDLLKGTLSRAYYAMFYAASAALVSEGLKLPKSHKTVLNVLYHHFVQTGKLPRTLHRDFARAFQLRQRGDYEIHAHLEDDEVRDVVEKAGAFVTGFRDMLGMK